VWFGGGVLFLQMKKSTILLPFSYLPIDVLVNLFANVSKIKVPRIGGSLVKLSEIKILCELYFFSHLPIYVLVNLFANFSKIKIPHVSGSLVKLSEVEVSFELYCLFHVYY
jgi:uncharacterized ubiquitin-like protein YukD